MSKSYRRKIPGLYSNRLGFRPINSDRWYTSDWEYLREKEINDLFKKPETTDIPPVLPDKVSHLLERVATDKEKRRKKKSFFKKVGKPKCISCQIQFNGEFQLNQHLNSKKHKNKVANQQAEKYCEDCKIQFEDLTHYQEHVASNKHRKIKVHLQNIKLNK